MCLLSYFTVSSDKEASQLSDYNVYARVREREVRREASKSNTNPSCLTISDDKMKADLLHRLESIPKSVESSHSVEKTNGEDNMNSTSESSSSDNESIVQELLKSMGVEEKAPENER